MKNILVALDFKTETGKLVDTAQEYSRAFNAKIWLIHAVAPNPDFVGFEAGPQSVRDNRAEEIKEEHKEITNWSSQLVNEGHEAEGLMIQGATVDTILEEAKKLEAELIIIGHHEHSAMYKLLIGSRDTELIKKSSIPVLIVPLD